MPLMIFAISVHFSTESLRAWYLSGPINLEFILLQILEGDGAKNNLGEIP